MKQSIEVRTAVEEEIHGVTCRSLEETPELIQVSQLNFQKELEESSSPMREIYDRIVESVAKRRLEAVGRTEKLHSPNYATEDYNTRLRFLRAELFDAKKAVERFFYYLYMVNELWGFELVSRRLVVQNDFNREELKYLKKGFVQLLPFRDRSGRRIMMVSDDPSDKESRGVSRSTIVSFRNS